MSHHIPFSCCKKYNGYSSRRNG